MLAEKSPEKHDLLLELCWSVRYYRPQNPKESKCGKSMVLDPKKVGLK